MILALHLLQAHAYNCMDAGLKQVDDKNKWCVEARIWLRKGYQLKIIIDSVSAIRDWRVVTINDERLAWLQFSESAQKSVI